MRSLPPPRKSRSRALKKFLRKMYRILTLQFIFKRKTGLLIVKRRKTPFHFTSRQYKVKTSRGIKRNLKKKHWYTSKRRLQQDLVTTLILNELSSSSKVNGVDINKVQFQKTSRLSRLRIKHSVHRQRMRRAFRRLVALMFIGTQASCVKDVFVVV